MSLDAAIMQQLQNAKQAQAMGAPMMGGPPFPAMPAMAQAAPAPAANNAVLLSVAVNNLPFKYTLQEADLRQMCERWGTINSTHVYRDGAREVGVVVFTDPVDASDCQRQLDGYMCSFSGQAQGAHGSLVAAIGEPYQLAGTKPPTAMPPGGPVMGQMPIMPIMPAGKGGGKGFGWSCKVVLHAERLHPDFPSLLKICGPDNANLGHIRSQGNCTVELRGRKSGTIDPRTGMEHDEPIYLWLANDSPESGLAALEMVKDLLGSVYDEHQQWCNQHKLQFNETLQPQVVENPHEGYQ